MAEHSLSKLSLSRKSNLMDAISFVLGVRTGQLRGTQLKDLIYAFDDKKRSRRAGGLLFAWFTSSVMARSFSLLGPLPVRVGVSTGLMEPL